MLRAVAVRRSKYSGLCNEHARMRRRDAGLRRAATQLQALRRGLTQARRYRGMRFGAVALQAAWRGAVGRRAFLRQKAASLYIQARWRSLLVLRARQASRVSLLCMSQMALHSKMYQCCSSNAVEARHSPCWQPDVMFALSKYWLLRYTSLQCIK